jgi:hypothetical protein
MLSTTRVLGSFTEASKRFLRCCSTQAVERMVFAFSMTLLRSASVSRSGSSSTRRVSMDMECGPAPITSRSRSSEEGEGGVGGVGGGGGKDDDVAGEDSDEASEGASDGASDSDATRCSSNFSAALWNDSHRIWAGVEEWEEAAVGDAGEDEIFARPIFDAFRKHCDSCLCCFFSSAEVTKFRNAAFFCWEKCDVKSSKNCLYRWAARSLISTPWSAESVCRERFSICLGRGERDLDWSG